MTDNVDDRAESAPPGTAADPNDRQPDADPRIRDVREFLAGARQRMVGQLQPSVMLRELAEARRMLRQLLDVIDGHTLTGYRSTMRQALRDAIRYCQSSGDAELLEQVGLYRSLARELGIEVDR